MKVVRSETSLEFRLDGIITEIIIEFVKGIVIWICQDRREIKAFFYLAWAHWINTVNYFQYRITEIDNWRVALEQTVAAIDLELKKLCAAKEAVEQAVETKVLPHINIIINDI